MKRLVRWAVLAAVWSVCYLISSAAAQGPVAGSPAASMPPVAGPRIAIIDVGKIFKGHARFKAWMEEMKNDVQRAEGVVRDERKKINDLEENLRLYQKGTQAYKDMEEQITARKADLTVKVQIQGKQFQQRQAKIYYNVYQEIQQATEYFCKQNSIDVVLQVSNETVDPEQAEMVIATIRKQVVWYAPDLDISNQILGTLNQSAINPARAADGRGAAAPPASPFNGGQQPQQQPPPR